MSRIGQLPIAIPKGVEVTVQDRTVRVKGPRGRLEQVLTAGIAAQVQDASIVFTRSNDEAKSRASSLNRTWSVPGTGAPFNSRHRPCKRRNRLSMVSI